MALSKSKKDQLLEWLGDGFALKTTTVARKNWSNSEWRAEYLCEKAASWRYHIYDAPAENDKRLVVFAYET